MVLATLSPQASAQPAPSGRGGVYGDWQLKVEFGEQQMDAILSLARNDEGNLTAQWISPWGVTDLKDVKLEENKLSFVQTVKFGDNEITSNFTGTIENDQVSGVLSSERGEAKVQGKRSPRIARAAGIWELKYKAGEQEETSTLVLKTNKEGQLIGQWQGRQGESEIADLQYERGTLAFKRKTKVQDRQSESTFSGTIEGDVLSGTMKSESGETAVQGNRVGAALIGTWNLEVTGEWGTIKQRLRVNPDMSGLYGTIPLEKVNLENDKVSFKMTVKFGDQEFDMSFAGKLDASKLTGEMTTPQGNQTITGTKVVRPSGRRGVQ
jgi:hypothetical protein